MDTVQLHPIRHTSPRCEDFTDELAVRRFEREIRVQRAHAEPYRIRPEDGRVDGAYRVVGATATSYRVDLVDGTGRHDTCDCPDFLTNDLGTCKHLEAVRRAVSRSPRLQKQHKALPAEPPYPVLAVDPVGGLRLRALGNRWTGRLLRIHGMERDERGGEIHVGAEEALRPGWHDTGLRVVHAAVPALERLRAEARLAGRRDELGAAFASGKVQTEVLSEPLFPYQRDGVVHLCSAGRALLADDMGLGKTVQAIAAAEILRRRGEARRIVVVTPASLKDQWAREIQRYAGERAVVVGGNPARRRAALSSDAPYKILNYELTWRELGPLRALDADLLVLDEAQRAKNFRTKTAATLRAIPSRFLFVVTGTPVENRLDDLYSLLQLVDPMVLGPLWRFNLDFHVQNEAGRIVGYKRLTELRRRIAPVVLRRRKDEVLLQLPPLTEQTRYTALVPEQKNLDEEYRAKAAKLLKIAEKRPLTKEEQERLMMFLLKARQACNALELCDPSSPKQASPKLDEFEALVGEIAAQGTAKILVFSEWVEMLKLAAARLDRLGIGYGMLYGGVPTEKRPALLQRFREDEDQRVLLSSDAGGVGLNLQVASYVVHLDLPWNPGKLDQRTARAHRLGQSRGVSVTYLCAEEGIERGIEGTLAGKRAVREAALDARSEADELEAPSFSVFLRQLYAVFEELAKPGEDVVWEQATETAEPGAEPAPPPPADPVPPPAEALPAQAPPVEPAAARPPASPSAGPGRAARSRAQNRLKLASLVLREGFCADAVRAAYDALGAAVSGLLDQAAPLAHDAIVAAIYRELLPQGRLPPAAHAALARLHDLTMLEAHGVELDPAIASAAVADAEQWVSRLAGEGATEPAVDA